MRIVVRPHSFIDVITNSSSELFIVKGDQDVEMINTMLKAHEDYNHAIHKVVKLNNQEELDAMMLEMIEDLTDYEQHPNMKIHDVLYANDIDDEDANYKQYRINAMKELIKEKKIEIKHELMIGDIVICGKENSLYGSIVDIIIKNFKVEHFFGEPI